MLHLPPYPSACTQTINEAIEHVSAAGGGRVCIPSGRHSTGTVILRSNVTLELSPGSVLEASPDIAEYPPLPMSAAFPNHLRRGKAAERRHLIVADDAENVTICGPGVIDGNSSAFTPPEHAPKPFQWNGAVNRFFIPTLEFCQCRNVRLRDFTIRESPGWTCHLCLCDEVRVENVTLLNHLYGGGTDGFDVDGSRDVWFTGCRIETGDDCIVMKSNPLTRSCERIVISRCILRSTCSAVKIGTESWADARNILFTDSVVHGSNRAFQIVCLDGGTVEDVIVDGLLIDTNSSNVLNRPIHIDLGYRRINHLKGHEEHRKVGRVRRVSISNLDIETDGRILLTAGDGGRLEDISLRNIRIAYPWIEDPSDYPNADLLQGSANCPESRNALAAIVAENIDRLVVSDVSVTWPTSPPGEEYLPKYQGGVMVRDPRHEFRPMPELGVFCGRNLVGEQIDLGPAAAPEHLTGR